MRTKEEIIKDFKELNYYFHNEDKFFSKTIKKGHYVFEYELGGGYAYWLEFMKGVFNISSNKSFDDIVFSKKEIKLILELMEVLESEKS